jgi:ubiquinone/menaquinone biosynthesis C-methylase UbiE
VRRKRSSSDVWGETARRNIEVPPLGWLDAAWLIGMRVFPLIFGDGAQPDGWWTQSAMQSFGVPPGGHWLDLGCGGGGAEIQMAANGLFDTMDAFDPSPGAIAVAQRQARDAGISNVCFQVADVNDVALPPQTYDVVQINMALHHVLELEHVVTQIALTLKPGGLFLANEYVGPSQFQFSSDRMALVAKLLQDIPDELRWNPNVRSLKSSQPRYSRGWWNRIDPTESVRSDEIPDVLHHVFTTVERRDYGGNLLNLVLENIVQNFRPDRKADLAILERLFAAEDKLLTQEPSDFAYFICGRPPEAEIQKHLEWANERHGRFIRPPQPLDADRFEQLKSMATISLEETPESARPRIGDAVSMVKRLARRGLRWYIAPAIVEQSLLNAELIEALQQTNEELRQRVEELEKHRPPS